MAYVYHPTKEELDAEALLKRKRWNVNRPQCPLCHGGGTIGKTIQTDAKRFMWAIQTDAKRFMWATEPCPNGCPTVRFIKE